VTWGTIVWTVENWVEVAPRMLAEKLTAEHLDWGPVLVEVETMIVWRCPLRWQQKAVCAMVFVSPSRSMALQLW